MTLSLLRPVGLLFLLSAVQAYDAGRDPPPLIESMSQDLQFDENNRLASYTLVFDATDEHCANVVTTRLQKHFINTKTDGERYQMAGITSEQELHRIFGDQPREGCRAACVERGVDRDLAGHVLPSQIYDSTEDKSLERWFVESCTKVEACVMNYHSKDHPLETYWIKYTGEKIHHMTLEYGNQHTRCFYTFLGHRFMAYDEKSDPENPRLIGELVIENTAVVAWGESPPSDQRDPSHNFDKEIERTLRHEWTRHNRITRTFSPLGFKKGRLPKDVFASLSAFYYNNAQNVVREEWKGKGVFVNWWETDVQFLQIPWDLKNTYQGRLKDMVEEWAGVPVEQTVMYGLRQYTQGARLLTHVDRHATHAVSLIVNIAQGNLTEPWPVEVQDHADRLHEVIMEPGDVVYYESAKCLHGRNRPMVGENAYFVNLFTHYKPVTDEDWWSQPNHEGTPEAVLGDKPLSEECRLVSQGIAGTGPAGQSVGLVQGVQCDRPELGPYISPSLFQATWDEDLIRWWKITGGRHEEETKEEAAAVSDTESNQEL